MFLDSTVLRLPGQFDVLRAQDRFFRKRRLREAIETSGPDRARENLLECRQGLSETWHRAGTGHEGTTHMTARRFSFVPADRQNADFARTITLAVLLTGLCLLAVGLRAEDWKTAEKWLVQLAAGFHRSSG